ncbi:DinB family protein [Actinopolymorpha rutila]|uniref:Putative damage-inducible protein DinB n=1 Tax=Actinopolymorpha rutila TaxID=446787 RepID=A0A852ZJM2_9ACTN|nr:DinB family protein [Actinopolymorpha rutila]NYH92098.1 putative damage-inducible protein DinB [Actinopolymorpha rutila]
MWTAPEVPRHGHADPLLGDERSMLEGRLEWHRATLLTKCAGLTGEQLAARVAPPSNLSLLGLIRHVAQVERTWFQRMLAGWQDAPRVYPTGGADFNDARPGNAEADYATLLAEMEASRETVAARGLDDEFTVPMWDGQRASVRWLYVHMIEEYARHNGHGDLLREQVDGTTGL